MLDRCINRWPTFIDCNSLDGVYVQQFLLSNGKRDYTKLQKVFHPDLISLISQIHIDFEEEDQLELMKKCSGKTVSAMVYEQMLYNKYNLEDVDYFNWLQKLKLKKKVEIFWWRLGKVAILTNLFLKNRRISTDDCCPRGCQVSETYEHIMVHCQYMIDVIVKMGEWGISIPVFSSLDCCLWGLKHIAHNNSGIVQIYCNIVYHSWKNRNVVKHGKSALPSSMVASNALFSAISNSCPYLTSWGANILRESRSTWLPPPKDWIKINVDASLLSSNLAGVGGVLRDPKGRFISAFGKKGTHWDIPQLELKAVFSVKDFLKSWKLECKLRVKCQCYQVHSRLSKEEQVAC
ncbi:uncharacterized protein LOC110107681 [Dendrobium catenatum]|uniref:uncharacterized protein LOC110107681 n=1 Tax=Dendrobium catenatum TaxID=906689 RepID=UPI0009F41B53|nr:uncharacterized protein LOC110107681 [Dendrobium catenatum]